MFGLTKDDRLIYYEYETPPDCQGSFATKDHLASLCAVNNWSKARVTAIWNSNAGKPPFADLAKVKRFRNRPYGIDRLWEMAQRLVAAVPEVVPEPDEPKAEEKPANGQFRDGSKAAHAVRLMREPGGIAGADLQALLGWQPHTVRGFISTLQSKHGIKIESQKTDAGRVYKVV